MRPSGKAASVSRPWRGPAETVDSSQSLSRTRERFRGLLATPSRPTPSSRHAPRKFAKRLDLNAWRCHNKNPKDAGVGAQVNPWHSPSMGVCSRMNIMITGLRSCLWHVCYGTMTLIFVGCADSPNWEAGNGYESANHNGSSERTTVMNPVNYFEIPVADMARAVRFYEQVLLVDFELAEIDGHPMALFPYHKDAPGITGALAYGESYRPGRQGARIYFTVTNIDATLRRAVDAGGQVLYPKTSIGEHGFVAEFEDTEGNCIAIRSRHP